MSEIRGARRIVGGSRQWHIHLVVYVQDKKNQPLRGALVEIVIEGVVSGGGRISGGTDMTGHAEFTTHNYYEPSRKLWIRVRGQVTVG